MGNTKSSRKNNKYDDYILVPHRHHKLMPPISIINNQTLTFESFSKFASENNENENIILENF